ncbi:sulfatase-like hydrolase/transferase [Haloferula helveola]
MMPLPSVALLAALALPALASFPEPPERPNFIVILMDDWGYNDIGCYTYPDKTDYYPNAGPAPNFPQTDPDIPAPNLARTLTPRLDQMADQGIRFTSYYSCARNCTPARASLVTGCYAPRVDMPDVINPNTNFGLNTTEITIAEILKTQGYATGMVGKWHLGYNPGQLRASQYLPIRHGFDSWLGIPYSNDMFQVENFLIEDETPVLTMGTGWANAGDNQHTINWRYTERALQFIEDHQAGPFFLYLAHSMPHVPTWPSLTTFTNADGTTWPQFAGASGHGYYYDIVMEIDHSMGRILDRLETLGIDDRTMVIFTSDNGPWLSKAGIDLDDVAVGSAYPLRESKSTTLEGGPRVPCIVRWPGMIPAGQVTDEVAGHIDLLPTLARLAGTEAPTDRVIDGKDIWPVLAGQPGAASPHSELYYYSGNTMHGVRQGPWKFRRPNATTRQLYHLDNDIQERDNEFANEPVLAAELEALIDSFETGLKAGERLHGNYSDQEIVIDTTRLTLVEGGSASFQVKLAQAPAGTVGVSVAPVFGDDGIVVSSGADLEFDAATWDTWQTVTVSAEEDTDTLDRGVMLRCSSTSFQPVREVFAFATDNDAVPQVEVALVWPRIPSSRIAGTDVLLHAEASAAVNTIEDPPGTTYLWSQPGGPGSVTFSDSTSPATGISFPLDGAYTIGLTASYPGAGSGAVSFDIEVGATSVITPAATIAHAADADPGGGPTWEDSLGDSARDWSLAPGVTRTTTDPAPSLPGLDAAYDFGGGSIPAGGRSLHLDAFSTGSATIDLWLRPDDLLAAGQQVIWETGGDIGASFTRQGSTVSFAVDDGGSSTATGAVAAATLAAATGSDGFIHLAGVIDLAGDVIRLYLNGTEAATAPIPAVNDWCGTSYSGLATIADSVGSETTADGHLGGNDLLGGGPWTTFDGQIASIGFYDRVLSPAEVGDLFSATATGGVGPQVDAGPDRSIAFTATALLSGSASDDGRPGPGPTTEWTKAEGPGIATIADPSSAATSATFSLPGLHRMRLFADDTQVRVYDDAEVSVAPLTYAEWASGIAFGPGEDGPLDNPDGDERVNLWEWTFGLNPLSPDPPEAGLDVRSEPISGGIRMIFEFTKPRDRQPSIVFQESAALDQWDDITTPTPVVTNVSATHEHWSFTYDIPDSVPRLFLRAKVTE